MQNLLKLLDDPEVHVRNRTQLTDKINAFRKQDLQIVADFDSTITQDNSYTSWSLFSKTGMLPEEYAEERNMHFNHYYPLEIDLTIRPEEKDSLMKEWWMKHLELFIKYKLNMDVIDNIIQNRDYIDFRSGMKEFLDISSAHDIPFIILSAGITNTINEFLRYHKTDHCNVHVISNELRFDDGGFCIGINRDNIIHSENKDEHDMPENIRKLVSGKKDIILIGDSLSDIKMVDANLRNDAIKIGFLGNAKLGSKDIFIDAFDIVIESNATSKGIPFGMLKAILDK